MVWRSPCRRTAEQSISQPSAERLVHEPHCPDYQVSTSTDCQQVTNAGPVVVTGVLPAAPAAAGGQCSTCESVKAGCRSHEARYISVRCCLHETRVQHRSAAGVPPVGLPN